MGTFKPLLPIGNKPAIEIIIENYKAAGIEDVYVVTGFNNLEITGFLKEKSAIEIHNEHFDEGMFSSIQAGIKVLNLLESKDIKGVILGLADCPLASKETINTILKRASVEEFIIPCYQGKKGHPIYIPQKYFQGIAEYMGQMGLKGFMNSYQNCMLMLETKDEAVVLDMDDKSGYEEILDFYKRKDEFSMDNENETKFLKTLLDCKRLFLIRHTEQLQFGEKIFLGQIDLPLSLEGVLNAEKIGEQLKGYNINTSTIYTSDLLRAKQTAVIIKEFFASTKPGMAVTISKKKDFREINLGDWDGKPIKEIRDQFPEAYLERGRNLLGYKIDAKSENFYDLKYRVLKELKKILKSATEKDIIIVTHAGVIQVIMSSFNEITLEEQLKLKIERGTICVVQNRKDL